MLESNVSGTPVKGPRFRTAAIILGLGIILALPGVIFFSLGLWHAVFGPTYATPGTAHVELGTGTYVVFEHTGNRSTYGPVSIQRVNGVTIDARQVRVVGPHGETVDVRNTSPNESIDRNSEHYTSAVKFTTSRNGTYTLRFDTSEPTSVMVQRPLGDLLARNVPWIIDFGTGWLVALLGMVMLLTGVIRRGRAYRRTQAVAVSGGVASAGWFSDPLGEQRLRYWDGQQWTHHTAD